MLVGSSHHHKSQLFWCEQKGHINAPLSILGVKQNTATASCWIADCRLSSSKTSSKASFTWATVFYWEIYSVPCHICIYIYVCMYMYMCICIFVDICLCIYLYMYVWYTVYIYIHVFGKYTAYHSVLLLSISSDNNSTCSDQGDDCGPPPLHHARRSCC